MWTAGINIFWEYIDFRLFWYSTFSAIIRFIPQGCYNRPGKARIMEKGERCRKIFSRNVSQTIFITHNILKLSFHIHIQYTYKFWFCLLKVNISSFNNVHNYSKRQNYNQKRLPFSHLSLGQQPPDYHDEISQIVGSLFGYI